MTDGEKIKQLRREQHLTQAQLAEKVSVKTATVSAWESGRILLKPERLYALGVILHYEFEGVDIDGVDDSFASQIKALRVQRGLSQAQFAKQIGVSNAAISRWENGAVPSRRIVLQQLEVNRVPLPPKHQKRRQSTNLGENLTRLRLKAGLSQKALGLALGVDDTSISAWETGRYMPSEGNLDTMCRYFGVASTDVMSKGRLFSSLWSC